MRTLKWLISIIVVLVLVVGVGMPFLIGFWIQRSYSRIFIDSHNASGIQMTLIDFKRGFFSSTAKVAIGFPKGDASNRIIFNQIIQHGPIVFDNGPILAFALANSKSEDPKFNASTRTIWQLNKRIVTTIQIPTVDVSRDMKAPYPIVNVDIPSSSPTWSVTIPAMHFMMQNLNMKINFHSTGKTLTTNAHIDKMEFQRGAPSPLIVKLNKIISLQDLNELNHIWYGNRSVNVADLTFKTSLGLIVQIQDISANSQITESSGKTNIKFTSQAKNSSILNNAIDSIDFAFSITGLDSKALSNVMEKTERKIDDQNYTKAPSLYNKVLELISKGLLVKLDHLTISTKQGQAKADGQVNLRAFGVENFSQLMDFLKIDFNLQIPRHSLITALTAYYQNDKTIPAIIGPARFAQQKVNQWIQAKVLIPSNNGLLIMKVQIENAKFLLNGVEQDSGPAAGTTRTPAAAT